MPRLVRRGRALAVNEDLETKLAGQARAHAENVSKLKRAAKYLREGAGIKLLF